MHDEPQTAAHRLKDAYERFLAGDPECLVELLSDQVLYHLPGKHIGGGTLQGRSALLHRLSAAASACDTAPTAQLLGALSAGDFVVTFERFQAKAVQGVLDQQVCVVWRFSQNRCVEIWSHFENQEACDAFWREVEF